MYNNNHLIIDLSLNFKSKNSSSKSSQEEINYLIFEYLFENLLDTSKRNNNLIELLKIGSINSIFNYQFDNSNLINDTSENNNQLIELQALDDTSIFKFNFQNLNDNSDNNNNLVEI